MLTAPKRTSGLATHGRKPRLGRRGWIIVGAGLPVLAFLAILGWASWHFGAGSGGRAVNSTTIEEPVEAAPAWDFELELLTGGDLRLSSLEGKVVMVDFWASWCPPCRHEAPTLAAVYREYRERGVEFIGVNIWDTPGDALLFLQEEGQAHPAGIDSEGKIVIDYGVRGVPEKYFIRRDGTIARKFAGPMNGGLLRDTLEELLSE